MFLPSGSGNESFYQQVPNNGISIPGIHFAYRLQQLLLRQTNLGQAFRLSGIKNFR